MINWIRLKLAYLHATFHDSEVIWLARINMAGGALVTGALMLDPNAFGVDPRIATIWTAVNGALSEYLRRRGATYDKDGNLV
jgi:hypothetical protein